ncbi:uncharacterized protein LOC131659773 [Vicia villosa]|uniref:uncharacterized protein LOC131659773 n=1 Tax=Vicia villosa TaxID=3911 RepID=UPI00273C2BAC|nr:uncharacterized protein LOC131659773 [Vicia villosa]
MNFQDLFPEAVSKSAPVPSTTCPEPNQIRKKKSFVEAIGNVCDIPTNQLPVPCVKGDRLSIMIPEDEYILGLESCKHNLHGRILWPKGSTPITVQQLKSKLQELWTSLPKWGVTSLGKGYYEFSFSSLEDVRRVRSSPAWNLNPGILKLFPWSKDFVRTNMKQSSAQVWVRIHGLAQEYWRPKILFTIASSIGTPICIDSSSNKPLLERPFGHFVRVLVDIDLLKDLRDKILVERAGFAFFVDLEYEKLPDFCSFCKIMGHTVYTCRRKQNAAEHQPKSKNTDQNNNSLQTKPASRGKEIIIDQTPPDRGQTSGTFKAVETSKVVQTSSTALDTPASIERNSQEIIHIPNVNNNQRGNHNTVLTPIAEIEEHSLTDKMTQ